MRKGLVIAGIIVVVLAVGTAAFELVAALNKQGRIRFIRSSANEGVLMAVDSDGLVQLNEVYALSKECTGANMSAAGNALLAVRLCDTSSKSIRGIAVKKGMLVIPDGTQAISEGRSFVLPGGRLTAPYSANAYDMVRDGAIEVERVRITERPNEGLEGWVQHQFLGRVCCGL